MSRPQTPASAYGAAASQADSSAPRPNLSSSRPTSYVGSAVPVTSELDHQSQGAPRPVSALSQNEEMNADGDIVAGSRPSLLQRSASQMSQGVQSRSGTLKKKASLNKGSLRRSGSRKSSYAGSVRSLKLGEKEKYNETDESNSIFFCPVPTSGNPTELLANRFQGKLAIPHGGDDLLIAVKHGGRF